MDEAQLYTLRVWRHAGRWRAVVRAVGEERSTLFTEPAPLAAWLLAAGHGTPPAPLPASPAGDGAAAGSTRPPDRG